MGERRRYALVGTGSRAEMFLRALATDHADRAEVVALADVNRARIDTHRAWLAELGAGDVRGYPADRFGAMLADERVDTVLVTTVDRTHADYVVAALHAGCDVITEKPMTTDVAGLPPDPRRRRRDRSGRAGRLQLPVQPGARAGP